jgi:hypothetical protein
MSTITTSTEAPQLVLEAGKAQSRRLFAEGAQAHYGDFRDDLLRDGFALVKGAVPRERADKYAEQMFEWLEELYGPTYPKTLTSLRKDTY